MTSPRDFSCHLLSAPPTWKVNASAEQLAAARQPSEGAKPMSTAPLAYETIGMLERSERDRTPRQVVGPALLRVTERDELHREAIQHWSGSARGLAYWLARVSRW
jgi:hypothetical protein